MEPTNDIQLAGGWRVLDAMANTGRPREPYTTLVLFAFGRALAQTRKRTAVFQWALKAAGELEETLKPTLKGKSS